MARTNDNNRKRFGSQARFRLGGTYVTTGALAVLSMAEIHAALGRHQQGDWGDVSATDREENEMSITEGFRILSVYRSDRGGVFWVITEADRSSTAVLLPEEY